MTAKKSYPKHKAGFAPDEQVFRLMFEEHSAVMLLIEPETGIILDANHAAVNFYGYPKPKLCSMSIDEINTLGSEQVAAERQKALNEERNYFVFPHRLSGGEERIVEVHSSPIMLQNKQALFSIIHDITKRKQGEKNLQKLERDYHMLSKNSPDLIARFDTHLKHTYVNPAAARAGKLLANEYVGRTIAETGVPEPVATQWEQRIRQVLNTREMMDIVDSFPAPQGLRYFHTQLVPELNPDGSVGSVLSVARDITERRQMEDALRESEDKFKYIFDHSVIGKSITLLSGEINANKALSDMFGYTQPEFQNRNWQELTHPEDVQLTQNEINALVSGAKESTRFTKRYIHKNGSIIWADISSALRRDQDRNPLYLITTVNDVTERKQAEQKLRELSRVVEQSHASIIITDMQGNIEYVNPKFTEITGYGFEEALGKNPRILKSGHTTREEYQKMWGTITAGNVWQGEFLNIRKNGESYWELATVAPILNEDGRIVNYLALKEDITERKQIGNEIEKIGRHYRALIEKAPDGIVLLDANGNFKFASPAAKKMFGYDVSEELTGNPVEFTYPDDMHLVLSELEKLLADPLYAPTLDYRYVDRNGTWKWVESTFSNLLAEPSVESIVINFRDITERKRTENMTNKRLELLEFSDTHSLDELLQKTLDEVCELTDSLIGFYHFVDGDQQNLSLQAWSTRTLQEFCKAEGKGLHYPISEAGIWADCVKTKMPAIHNNYPTQAGRKGLPKGHAAVLRQLVVPILRADKIVAILGVGNKPTDYTQKDAELVTYFADIAWESAKRKLTEQKLHSAHEFLRSVQDALSAHIAILDDEGNIVQVNSAWRDFGEQNGLRYPNYGIGMNYLNICESARGQDSDEGLEVANAIRDVLSGRKNEAWIEYPCHAPNEKRWFIARITSFKNNEKKQIVVAHENITERKQAENALFESEKKYRLLFDQLLSGIAVHEIICDPQGIPVDYRFLAINAAFENMTGIDPTVIGKTVLEFMPMTEPIWIERYGQVALTREPTHFESYSGTLDKYFDVHAFSPEPGQFATIFNDVTESKQAEENIRRHVKELELLYESGLAFSQLLNPKQIAQKIIELLAEKLDWHHTAIRLIRAQDESLELVAFDQPGLENIKDERTLHEHLSKVVTRLSEGLSGWAILQSQIIRSGDVSQDPHYVASFPGINSGLYVPLKSGENIVGVISIESEQPNAFSAADEHLIATLANQAANAFENARMVEELEQRVRERTTEIESTRQRLALAVKAAGIGIWELDVKQNKDYWEDGLFTLYGLSKESAAASSATWRNAIHLEDLAQQLKIMDEALHHNQPYNTEFRVVWPDASVHHIKSTGVIIYDEAGAPEKMIGANQDITLYKQAEETLHHANLELERGLRMKNEFLANMSHELRTPLNAILGISESLEEQISGSLNQKQIKYVHIITESGRHLLELINDILDLSKIEAGKLELDIQSVSVEKLCASSLRMFKELAQKKSLNVSFRLDKNVKVILGDERRLKQSLVNLIGNAVKFTPPGKNIGLEVNGYAEKNIATFTIWDEGIGIAPQDIPLLFKPFVQLNAGLAREFPGTGLGLALVSQMIHLHGGSISLRSELKRGSLFTITLPWMPKEQRLQSPIKPQVLADNSKLDTTRAGQILIVDDTEVVTQLISEYLQHKGYKTLKAYDGAEAVLIARQEHPQIILMDVMMPVMDGLEATRAIRADPVLRDIPIIGLTALAMPEDRAQCLAAGMNDYLSKPIQIHELVQIIERYLSLKR